MTICPESSDPHLPLRCIARLRAQGPAHQPAGVPERGGPAGARHHAGQARRPSPHEPRQTGLGTHLATLWHFPFSIIHHKIAKYCASPVCRLGDRRVPRRAPLPDPPGEGRPRPRLLHAHPLHWRQAPAVGQLQRGECPVSCNCVTRWRVTATAAPTPRCSASPCPSSSPSPPISRCPAS